MIYRKRDLETLAIESEITRRLLDQGVRSLCSVPLLSRDKVFGTLDVMRSREQDFTPAESELLSQVAQQIAIAVENALAYQEIAVLKESLSKEKLYLEEELHVLPTLQDFRAKAPIVLSLWIIPYRYSQAMVVF